MVKLRNSSMNSREENRAAASACQIHNAPSVLPFEECPANDKNRTFYNEFNSHHPASGLWFSHRVEDSKDPIFVRAFQIN